MVPLKAVTDSADHYMEKEEVFVLEEDQKIRLVSRPFLPEVWGHSSVT